MKSITNKINEIVSRHFSDPSEVTVRYMSSGSVNSIYSISLKNKIKYILRVCDFLPQTHRQHLENDIYLDNYHPELKGLKAKSVVYYCSKDSTDVEYAINTYVEGNTLDCFQSKEVYFNAGMCLARVHSTDGMSRIGPVTRTIDLSNCSALDYYWKYFNDINQILYSVDKDLAYRLRLFNEKFFDINAYSGQAPVLLHGDIHPRNILVDSWGTVRFVDWDCAKYGYSEQDLVKLFHFKWSMNQFSQKRKLTHAFLDGYEKIRPLHFTRNLDVHTINWFAKLLTFELMKPDIDNRYYFDPGYYYKKMKQMLDGSYSYKELLEI